jgi:hypothetical protein
MIQFLLRLFKGQIMPPTNSALSIPSISIQDFTDFEAAAARPLRERFKYAFIRTYKPVLDDEAYRVFETMSDYRQWCEKNLPDWLGYGRV